MSSEINPKLIPFASSDDRRYLAAAKGGVLLAT